MQLRSTLPTGPCRRNVKNPYFSSAAATTTVSLVFCRKQLPAAFLPPAESWMRGAFCLDFWAAENADCRAREGRHHRDPRFGSVGCRWVRKNAESAASLTVSQRQLAHRSGASFRLSVPLLSPFRPRGVLQIKPIMYLCPGAFRK